MRVGRSKASSPQGGGSLENSSCPIHRFNLSQAQSPVLAERRSRAAVRVERRLPPDRANAIKSLLKLIRAGWVVGESARNKPRAATPNPKNRATTIARRLFHAPSTSSIALANSEDPQFKYKSKRKSHLRLMKRRRRVLVERERRRATEGQKNTRRRRATDLFVVPSTGSVARIEFYKRRATS